MKANKIEKKLVFKKETVVNLDKKEMNSVHGGENTLDDCTYRICTKVFVCGTGVQC